MPLRLRLMLFPVSRIIPRSLVLNRPLLLMFAAETNKNTPPVIEPEFTQLFMGVRVLPVVWSNRNPTLPYMIAVDGVFVKLNVLYVWYGSPENVTSFTS